MPPAPRLWASWSAAPREAIAAYSPSPPPLSGRSPHIDRRAARRNFERAARTYGDASRLEREIGSRMLERLDYVKLAPRRILDAGSGPAREAFTLAARYRPAHVLALDFSLSMLRAGRGRWPRRNPASAVCADLERLPFADASFELVWSN